MFGSFRPGIRQRVRSVDRSPASEEQAEDGSFVPNGPEERSGNNVEGIGQEH